MKAISRFLCLTVLGLLAGNGGYALTKQLHVQTAGTLPQLIQETEQYEITELTLTGTLNGTDLHYLRQMAGGDDKGGYTPGKLTVADLGGTRIVAGGEAVYDGWRAKTDTLPGFLFYGTKVERVVLPAGVRMIERGAFCACSKLAGVTLPPVLKTIARDAFAYCTALTAVQFPESLETIGQGAFQNCIQLRDVRCAEGLHTIAYQAFSFCISLESMALPTTLTRLEMYAFYECTALKKITIAGPVTKLDRGTFEHCAALTDISLPATLDTVGVFCFAKCFSLETIRLPEQMSTLEKGAFSSCSSLLSVTLPNRLDTIPAAAFIGCGQLRTVIMPSELKAIEWEAFNSCGQLDRICLKSKTPPALDSTAFDYISYNFCTLEVPYNCTGTYRNHPMWGKFGKVTESIPTHVESPVADQPEVTLNDNNLTVQTAPGQTICVYTPEGRLLRRATGILQATLRTGLYVVRAGTWGHTVSVL